MLFFFFQAEDGIRDYKVTGVQTCALPISMPGVEREDRIERRRAPLRMLDGAGKIRWTHATKQRDPALVQRRQQIERHRDRGAHLRCLGPVLLFVCLDRRCVLGEPPLEAHVGVYMTVWVLMA